MSIEEIWKEIPFVIIVGEFCKEEYNSFNSVNSKNKTSNNKLENKNSEETFGQLSWENIWNKFEENWANLDLPKGENEDIILKEIKNLLEQRFVPLKVNNLKDPIKKLFERVKNLDSHRLPPIPLPFNDSFQFRATKEFEKLFNEYLINLNILSIISCSPAENTDYLLNRTLQRLEIPLFITVSSIIKLFDDSHRSRCLPARNILRLIPTNDSQAQSIIEKIFSIEHTKHLKEFIIFTPERDDLYVMDLTAAIKNRVRDRDKELKYYEEHTLSDDKDILKRTNIIVSIGYGTTLFKLIFELGRENNNRFVIIQTDGCTKKQAQTFYDKWKNINRQNNRELELLLSRPAILHEDYAKHAYAAICKVWKDECLFLNNSNPSTSCPDMPISERLRPFVDLVREELEKEYEHLYYFISNENQRGGFHIQDISSGSKRHENKNKTKL